MDGIFKMWALVVTVFSNTSILLTSNADFILSSSFLVLIIGAPRQSNSNFQRSAVYIAVVIIVMMFSALIKDFKIKNGGMLKRVFFILKVWLT